MPRRVEDIVPSGHRSIRDIPLKNEEPVIAKSAKKQPKSSVIKLTKKESPKKDAVIEEHIEIPEEVEKVDTEKPVQPVIIRSVPIAPPLDTSYPQSTRSRRGLKISLLTIGIVVVLGVVGYYGSGLFSRAIFTIKVHVVPVTVSTNSIIATSAPLNESLVYETALVNLQASTTVPATVGSHIESKAAGTVTVYNTYSATPWRLIAGTRFISESGLVYRLTSSISVPAYTKSASGSIIGGQAQAAIAADLVGDKYNMQVSDPVSVLHVAAYAKTSKYDSVIAKVSSAIRGGFSGNKITVSPQVLSSNTATLQARIVAQALLKLKSTVPEGYILYDSANTAVFDTAQISNANTSNAVVSLSGRVYGIMFKKLDLISKLAGASVVQSFKGMPFDAQGLEQLSFNISNLKDFSPIRKGPLSIQVSGSMKLAGIVPVDELKKKFAGITLTATEGVMRAYSPIIDLDKSTGEVVPPWSKIPTNTDKISIVLD